MMRPEKRFLCATVAAGRFYYVLFAEPSWTKGS